MYIVMLAIIALLKYDDQWDYSWRNNISTSWFKLFIDHISIFIHPR